MAIDNILNINTLAARDDTIIKKEIYPYAPYTTTYGDSEEIRITIQSQDSYLLPCESYLYMQITATTAGAHGENDPEVNFVKNYISFLFSDVRYELNGVEIDRVRNVGRSSTLKLLIASRTSQLAAYKAYCSSAEATVVRSLNIANVKKFDVVIPLSVWFGFCDDYRKIIINCKHELILNRSRNSNNCVLGGGAAGGTARVTLELTKIQWKMPHITLSDSVKLSMMNYLSKNRKITIQYRSMDLMEYPALPQTQDQMWAVKTVSHLNRPRYVIVAFQTGRENVHTADASKFDACNVREIRLHMNSQIYPYNMNEINFGDALFSELYNMYRNIQTSFYNGTEPKNLFAINYADFQESPIYVFDTSRADESLIDSSVDIKIEIKTRENIPANTAAFCLIIYDIEFTYSPFDGIVARNI